MMRAALLVLVLGCAPEPSTWTPVNLATRPIHGEITFHLHDELDDRLRDQACIHGGWHGREMLAPVEKFVRDKLVRPHERLGSIHRFRPAGTGDRISRVDLPGPPLAADEVRVIVHLDRRYGEIDVFRATSHRTYCYELATQAHGAVVDVNLVAVIDS